MPMYLIVREMAGLGKKSQGEIREIASKAWEITKTIPGMEWVCGYIADDRSFTIYNAPNEDAIREHSRKSGLPITRIELIHEVIDPGFLMKKAA